MTEDNTLRACVDCKSLSSGDDGNSCSKYKKFDPVSRSIAKEFFS